MSKMRYRIFSDTAFDGSYAYVTYRNDKEPEKTYVNSKYQKAETSLCKTCKQLFILLAIGLMISFPLYYNIMEKHPFNVLLLFGCMLIVLIAAFNEMHFYIYCKMYNIKTYRINDEQNILHCSCCGAQYYEKTIKKCWKCGNDIINENNI